ncbi:hypothetical protein WMY93_003072 [Mugilogobius chulae]|uniref:Ig-like domain-containing protein n=1 Tax=Mugilogobius chulae TaxID=88201 RepID=A0AAW0PVL0_9GOBI
MISVRYCLLVLLSVSCSGADGQSLVQSGAVVLSPGGSHKLTCTYVGFRSDRYFAWIRQAAGKGLEWISYINYDSSTKRYSDSVKNRFTVSRDNSREEVYLHMSGLRADDSATYYCARDTVREAAAELYKNYFLGDIAWIRQAAGKGLEWISYISSSSGTKLYSDSVKNRFTVSRDNSRKEVYLHMSGLRADDSATYYCARDTCSSQDRTNRDQDLPETTRSRDRDKTKTTKCRDQDQDQDHKVSRPRPRPIETRPRPV